MTELKALGFEVVQAIGEADCLMANMARAEKDPVTCIGIDSDLCFGPYSAVLRPKLCRKTHSMKFTIFKPELARTTLNLTRQKWILLAVTSGNDFSSIKGLGINKAYAILQDIKGNGIMKLLSLFCTKLGCGSIAFKYAIDIFVHGREEFSNNVSRPHAVFQAMKTKIDEWKEKCRRRKLVTKSDPMIKCQHSRCNSRCHRPCVKHFCDSECSMPCFQLGHNGTKQFYFKYRHVCTTKCPTVCEESNASRKAQPRVLGKALPKKKPKKPKKQGILKYTSQKLII